MFLWLPVSGWRPLLPDPGESHLRSGRSGQLQASFFKKGLFLSPLAGGLSELPDRKHAASIHAQKGNERSSAISNVGVATICLVFFNLQPRALLRLKKINKKTGGKQKLNLAAFLYGFSVTSIFVPYVLTPTWERGGHTLLTISYSLQLLSAWGQFMARQ